MLMRSTPSVTVVSKETTRYCGSAKRQWSAMALSFPPLQANTRGSGMELVAAGKLVAEADTCIATKRWITQSVLIGFVKKIGGAGVDG